MIKKTLICIIFLSFLNTSSNSIASTGVIVDEAVNKLIKNLGNVETATKGKKIKDEDNLSEALDELDLSA